MSHDASDQASPPAAPAPTTRRDFLAQTGTGLLALAAAGGALGGAGAPAAAGEISEWLSVKDFGARGDGSTDDGPALLRLRDYMSTLPDKHFSVLFPPGTYVTSATKWLDGALSVTLDGQGAALKSISPGGDTFAIYQMGVINPGSGSLTSGSRFRGAVVGAMDIRLVSAADAALFAPGMRVILWGMDIQFGGLPPNFRYFEWNQVASVNAATATLGLTYPLKNSYDNDWWDTDLSAYYGPQWIIGKPRILPLERTNYRYPKLLEIRGMRFLNHPTKHTAIASTVEQIRLIEVETDSNVSIWPSQNRMAEYIDCIVNRTGNEFDKLCDFVHVRGGRWNKIGDGGTGINRVLIENVDLRGSVVLSARQVETVSSEFNLSQAPFGVVGLAWGDFSSERIMFRNNRINLASATVSGTENAQMACYVNTDIMRTFTVEDVSALGAIRLAYNDVNRNMIKLIGAGTWIYKPDCTNYGVITRISFDGSNFLLYGRFRNPVSAGDIFEFPKMGQVEETSTNVSDGAVRQAARSPIANMMSSMGSTYILKKGTFAWNVELPLVYGFVKRLQLSVSRGYVGTHSSPRINVRLLRGSESVTVLDWDLRTIGTAVVDSNGLTGTPTTGLKGGAPLPANWITRTLRINTSDCIGASVFPDLMLEAELEPLSV
jgi:hypothetical protein